MSSEKENLSQFYNIAITKSQQTKVREKTQSLSVAQMGQPKKNI